MTTPGAEELVELPFDSGAWKVGSMVQCCVRRTEDWSVRYRTWGGDCTTLVPTKLVGRGLFNARVGNGNAADEGEDGNRWKEGEIDIRAWPRG